MVLKQTKVHFSLLDSASTGLLQHKSAFCKQLANASAVTQYRDKNPSSLHRSVNRSQIGHNYAVQHIQPKLSVDASSDQYEQEADHVAAQVMVMPDPVPLIQRGMASQEKEEIQSKPLASVISPLQQEAVLGDVQTKCEACEEEQVQRKPGSTVQTQPDLESRLNGSKSGGRPLPDDVRSFMESRFEADFSKVRVHTDSAAVRMNRELEAQAFTHRSDIYYGAGKAPGNDALTAHELTHVIQQTGLSPLQQMTGDASVKNGIQRSSTPPGITQLQVQSLRDNIHIQRNPEDPGLKELKCTDPEYAGDTKLNACLNNLDRLQPGDTGSSVEKIQRGLNRNLEKDGVILKVDGIFAAEMGQAVIFFKKKHKLGSEGFPDVGPKTMEKLDQLCSTSKSNTDSPIIEPKPPISPQPFFPELPVSSQPKNLPGPLKPKGSPTDYCTPYTTQEEAWEEYPYVIIAMMAYTSILGSEVQNLWLTYLQNPKVGTKGTLPPRKIFSDEKSRVVQEFRLDPETHKQKSRVMKLLADRVRSNFMLMPRVGQSTSSIGFKDVLPDSELLDLPMSFGNPATSIPGNIAGGYGKNSSDAGDDVRNVDGNFVIKNIDESEFQIQADFVFNVFDCVDFCPGNPGGEAAQKVTIPMSRLEATPDVPTYDVPFEVIYGLSDEQTFDLT